ncbi:unnamed protein product [Echinostoma caproni]|uniref:TORC_M domain-containing protein n=1 Tax=Echinostoma caproni TaxID=27848 RepID=A0A183ALP6_9TREM|nr:unnamed protein product [Echinostoma caproni]
MFHSQGIRPNLGSISASGVSIQNSLQHPPLPTGSLLYRKVHPDKSCGRWSDAHVRIARFIHVCQSLRPGSSHRDDRKHISPGTSFPTTPHSVVRPVARPAQPHPLNSRTVLNPNIAHHPPRLHSPQMLSGPRQWDSLVHPRPLNQPPISTANMNSGSTNTSVEDLEKNAFWNYMNNVMASLPPSELVPSHSVHGTEAMDLFWTSVLQRLGRSANSTIGKNNNNNAHLNLNNHPTNPNASNNCGKQPAQLYSTSSRTNSGLTSLSSEPTLPSADHIPLHGPRHAPSNPPMFPHPSNSLRHGSHSGPHVTPQLNHMDGNGIRLGLDMKRPRLEPTLGHCDQTAQTPFPLLQRLPHPNALSTSAPPHNKQDLLEAAARLLNGFHALPPVPTGGVMHQTNLGLNEPSGPDSLDKNRLKMGGVASNLAPIHRW